MKRIVLTASLLAAFCAAAHAQATDAQAQTTGPGAISEEKRRDIIRLLELTKSADLGAQIVHQSIDEMRQNFSMLPAEQRDRVLKVMEEEMLKEFSKEKLSESIVPIYDKYLTADEVKQLVAFYETPLGHKLVDVLPQIFKESYADGLRRGREASLRAMARIAEEGLLEPPPDVQKMIQQPAAKPKPAASRHRRARRRHN